MRTNRSTPRDLRKQLRRWKEAAAGTPRDASGDAPASSPSFRQTMRRRQVDLLDLGLQELIEALDKRGNTLREHPSLSNVRAYKRTIASFLQKSLELSKAIRRLQGRRNLPSFGPGERDKEHVIVETVDEELEALTRTVLQREAPQLSIAEHLGEIRGLLVDLHDRLAARRP